jgi:hypothetical protein
MSPLLPPGSYYGETQGSLRVGGFTLCESSYAPGERIPMHAHEHAFFYLREGRAGLEARGARGSPLREAG